MNRYAYSLGYFPSAPVIPTSIAAPEESDQLGPFEALVDTGADGTFVPLTLLEQLEVPVAYTTNARSHFGDKPIRVAMFTVDLILFNTLRLPSIDVVGDQWGEGIILGRNVLNLLKIQLDGPLQALKVE